MALNVSAWSIRKPLPAIVVSAIFVLLGAISFARLPITRMPNVDLPIVSVMVAQFGAAPAELETQVCQPIEDAIAGITGVRHIFSTMSDGVSVTIVQFNLDANTDRAINDVKDAVTRARGKLPQNINEPLIQRLDVFGLPIVTYAAIAPGKTPQQLSFFVDDVVKRALQGVRGVGRVERIGGVDREISVALDPARLQAMGLTAVDVGRQLRGTKVDVAGGRAEIGGRQQAIRTVAAATGVADLSAALITLPRGGEVRLDSLGTVTDTIAEPRTFARLDGKPVVGFDVLRAKNASDVTVAVDVGKKIDEIRAAHPEVTLQLIDTSTTHTYGIYEAAMSTLFEGAALAVVVVFLFLRDVRATIIAGVTLPLSIMPAFWAMDLFGFSLNLISLLAITLSTGILVDDAIVEIENIERHMAMGKPPFEASIDAADEIGGAVIAISLTIIAIFVPVSFMGSIAGQFFKQFGATVSVQIFFSLLCARFVVPVLTAYLLRHRVHKERPPGPILRLYGGILRWSVRHYLVTILLGLGLFAASVWSLQLLPSGFLPAQDISRSLLAVELPPGSPMAATQTLTEEIARRLHKLPEVKSVFVDGGRIPPSTTEVRKASVVINYVPKDKRSRSQRDLELAIIRTLQDVPDIRYWFLDDNGNRGIQLIVSGPDAKTVANVAAELGTQMRRIPILANVVADASIKRPEMRLRPRSALAARLGVTTESLAETMRIATIGDFEPALAKLNADNQQIPIRVQLDDSIRGDREALGQLRVPLPGARGSVPVGALADITLEQGPITIDRYDRASQATMGADLVGETTLGEAMTAINALPLMTHLPPGIAVTQSGDAENMKDLFDEFAVAMRNGLMMVLALLILLFASFLQPVTILFSLPLSIGGAILALLITGRPFSLPVTIGILMLMGIVTKNAIMLVDFANAAMREGMPRAEAAAEAGLKRARPVVMTTIAMVAGMVPSALAHGSGGEIRAPMAIAVIGGLSLATLLSLIFVPAMFLLMDKIGTGLGGLLARIFLGRRRHENAPAHAGAPAVSPEGTAAE